MSVFVPPGSTLNRPVKPRETFTPQDTPTVAQAPARAGVAQARSETHRWLLILGTPFVLGATFFALAIALGAEWPMAPAFVFGPLLLVAGYIVLSLTSEANTTSA